MEKKDLLVLALAIVVVMGIALVVKPFLAGDPIPKILPGQVDPIAPPSTPVTTTPVPSIPSPTPSPVVQWTQFAVLTGNRSGTTEEFYIPFSSWEMQYTANLSTISDEQGVVLLPRMRIQVVDAEDPSRIVCSLEPDLLDARIATPYDPRPWKERIEEGNHRYFLVIHIQEVPSYSVEILVPSLNP
jgi:hypothetical protein